MSIALLKLPTLELLKLWSELDDCYHRAHGFGTDTAEIYAYRLLRDNPTLRLYKDDSRQARQAEAEQAAEAYQILHAVLTLYTELQECTIEVDGCPLSQWLRGDFNHRVHVKVTPNRSR